MDDPLPSAGSPEPPSGPLLGELVQKLTAVTGFTDVVASLSAGHGATLDGVWGSSCALAAAALLPAAPSCLVLVAPHPADVEGLASDLRLFSTEPSDIFPAADEADGQRVLRDEVWGQRLALLKRLALSHRPRLVVTSMAALMQPVASPETIAADTRILHRGDQLSPEDLARWLAEHDYQPLSGVELPGEFCLHGGILDVFALDWEHPVRIEFFGDEIESIRRFEVSSQRSLSELDQVELTLIDLRQKHRAHLADHLPSNAWWLLVEPGDAQEEARHYLDRVDHPLEYHTANDVLARIGRFPSATAESVSEGSLETSCHLQVESVERFRGDVAEIRKQLDAITAGQQVWIVCPTEAEIERLTELLSGTQLAQRGQLRFGVGYLQHGFRLVPAQVTLLSSSELFQRPDVPQPVRRQLSRAIDSFLDLRAGDHVVHVGHGIAKYLGLTLLEKGGGNEEHLELEFQGGTRLFVPASKIGLVQKYVGGTRSRPTLAKIGGRAWTRQKAAAEEAVADMAQDMLQLQAVRASRPGIAFPADTDWQREFDASFPFQETPDQLAAIAALKHDMAAPRPMDRLICGDVGYGKTEVAMRAAFKAVDSGYQVAVLVPTTVLAEQHRRTFTSRLAEYPFRIASLSRFLTRKQQTEVLAELAAGRVDIIIGTHRLVQPDVQIPNLGLIIIDEEQRFGVDVKERLKALRQVVDVLTLTATPIPRTLHLSLLGLRDISNLETPPAERLAVETRVTRWSDELIRHSLLRELNRGGQAYFVHNRVHDIELVSQRLQRIVPEATIRIAHGQMPEHELEQVMLDFVEHRCDILLATTIVESGLDIRNANTIFIDQADIYGLADLHQLRGRVGRYHHRAYCYLLVDPAKSLSSSAAKRLRAIEEFSEMGAGFAIAMRDLEIRGAGNILGTQQSGHIAAVGYELYCQLLEHAVRRLKHETLDEPPEVHVALPGNAYLPRQYVPDLRHKIDLYRRFSRLTLPEQVDALAAELVDRFGPIPPVVEQLLDLARLRVWAQAYRLSQIHWEEGYLVLQYASRPDIERLARRWPRDVRIVDEQSAYVPLAEARHDFPYLFSRLKSLLLAEPPAR